MPARIIETKMGMYFKVRDFGLLYGPEIEKKHTRSLTARFQSHNTDVALTDKLCKICLVDRSQVVIDKVNTRAELHDLAHNIFHLLHPKLKDSSETHFTPRYAANLTDAHVLEDMEFYNFIRSYHEGLQPYIDMNAVPVEPVYHLEKTNHTFLGLLEKAAEDNMERQEAGRNILRTTQRIDDRLHVMDILVSNFQLVIKPCFMIIWMRATLLRNT
jgi:hypothetical protein